MCLARQGERIQAVGSAPRSSSVVNQKPQLRGRRACWWKWALLVCVVAVQHIDTAEAGMTLSTDHRPVSFGLMRLEEEKTLAELGAYHHQITCSSTNGLSWYLKIQVLSPLSSGAETIPLEQFQWEVTSTSGRGTLTRPHQFTAFSLVPDLVSFSAPDEASGQTVTFQLRYLLKIPARQVSGIYQTTIRLTLTEVL